MIKILKNEDIFASNADVYFVPVNCVGIMGKGLALEFKKRYPALFKEYKGYCEIEPRLTVGKPYFYYQDNKNFVLFPTKDHWRQKSKICYISDGLYSLLIDIIQNNEFKSYFFPPKSVIAVPALGCGEGGLDWNDVRPLLETFFSNPFFNDKQVLLYEPQ